MPIQRTNYDAVKAVEGKIVPRKATEPNNPWWRLTWDEFQVLSGMLYRASQKMELDRGIAREIELLEFWIEVERDMV